VLHDEVHHSVREEVAHADPVDPTVLVELLHVTPGSVDVAEGLVDRMEVQVVELESLA
jgi:hypothetical protein